MDSPACVRLVTVDEHTPIATLNANDYLDRLPWLTDHGRGRGETRSASSLLIWPIMGAATVAMLSYVAAQASFADLGRAQVTVELPPATSVHHLHATARPGTGFGTTGAAAHPSQAEYLAQIARELEQLKSSDPPDQAGQHTLKD